MQHEEQMLQLQIQNEEWRNEHSFVTEIRQRVPLHLELPVKCWDVAVMADGHLLLAAWTSGMLEYDESGRQLSSWTPANTERGEEDWVCTVDEMQDGRVAVGLYYARSVQLLRLSAARDSWQQELVIQLQRGPEHLSGASRWLSVHAQLMAVAEWGKGQLVLYSLPEGRELLRLEPGYYMESLAATADAVITASRGQVQLNDDRKQHVVDSYSHRGQLLWRQSFSGMVHDLHWVQSHSVVFLALQDCDRVTAVRAVDGQLLSEVFSRGPGPKNPYKLSVSRGQRTVLAVLNEDRKTVTVYPALGSSGSQ